MAPVAAVKIKVKVIGKRVGTYWLVLAFGDAEHVARWTDAARLSRAETHTAGVAGAFNTHWTRPKDKLDEGAGLGSTLRRGLEDMPALAGKVLDQCAVPLHVASPSWLQVVCVEG